MNMSEEVQGMPVSGRSAERAPTLTANMTLT
jgi:hypothetical protein